LQFPIGASSAPRSTTAGSIVKSAVAIVGISVAARTAFRDLAGTVRASCFATEDVVENRGYQPTEHMLLYHINVGCPFVDDGAELIAPVAGPPRLLFGTADVHDRTSWSRFVAPQRNWVQQTFEHRMIPDDSGTVEVAIFNPRLFGGTGLSVRYDHGVMPNYIECRMMGEGQYAIGIEPCTNGFGRSDVAAGGNLIVLEPGESRTCRSRMSIISAEQADAMGERAMLVQP
jgi:hypothetical protein